MSKFGIIFISWGVFFAALTVIDYATKKQGILPGVVISFSLIIIGIILV